MIENDANIWYKLASDIENNVTEAYERLCSLSDETIGVRPNPGDWSVKQIVGHLVDSASNNHQRFVRLQVADGLVFPDYSQDNDTWVSIQSYQEAPWDELLALWLNFHLHLARVIRTVNEECIDHIWVVDEDTSITLGSLMIDYLRHLKDHLQQISELIGDSIIAEG
jgi:DinB superfamily